MKVYTNYEHLSKFFLSLFGGKRYDFFDRPGKKDSAGLPRVCQLKRGHLNIRIQIGYRWKIR